MLPKISVVIPVYNSAKYLRECLDSVVSQSFSDWEVVAVDDGSPDESPAILDEYAAKESRIKVIHKENGGVSAARNDGLVVAAGEYVLFVDSDDYLEQDALRLAYEEAIRVNADVVIGDYFAVSAKGRRRYHFFSKSFVANDRTMIEKLQQTMLYSGYSPYFSNTCGYLFGAQWTKLFRRSMLIQNAVNFPTSISLFEDGVFGLTAFEHSKVISYLSVPFYNYRVLTTSLCHSYKYNNIDLYKRISSEVCSLAERFAKGPDFYDAYETRFIYYAKKQVGQIFASNMGFWNKYRECKKLLTNEFYVPFLKKIAVKPLVMNERLFGRLVRLKLYLLLSVLMQVRRG